MGAGRTAERESKGRNSARRFTGRDSAGRWLTAPFSVSLSLSSLLHSAKVSLFDECRPHRNQTRRTTRILGTARVAPHLRTVHHLAQTRAEVAPRHPRANRRTSRPPNLKKRRHREAVEAHRVLTDGDLLAAVERRPFSNRTDVRAKTRRRRGRTAPRRRARTSPTSTSS